MLKAIREAHSYEEPAIDVYPLVPEVERAGAGRHGRLAEPTTLVEFAKRVAEALSVQSVVVVGDSDKRVERVAVACGAGGELIDEALRQNCDVIVTGEVSFHRQLYALSSGLGLILAGHFETERPGVELLAQYLKERFTGLEVWASHSEHSPARLVSRL